MDGSWRGREEEGKAVSKSAAGFATSNGESMQGGLHRILTYSVCYLTMAYTKYFNFRCKIQLSFNVVGSVVFQHNFLQTFLEHRVPHIRTQPAALAGGCALD